MKYITLESSIFSLAFFVLLFISNVSKGAIFYSIQDGNWEDQAVWS